MSAKKADRRQERVAAARAREGWQATPEKARAWSDLVAQRRLVDAVVWYCRAHDALVGDPNCTCLHRGAHPQTDRPQFEEMDNRWALVAHIVSPEGEWSVLHHATGWEEVALHEDEFMHATTFRTREIAESFRDLVLEVGDREQMVRLDVVCRLCQAFYAPWVPGPEVWEPHAACAAALDYHSNLREEELTP